MVARWEYSLNDLTFGGATDFGITKVDGLGPPDAREDITDRPSEAGAFIWAEFPTYRRVTFEGEISSTILEQRVTALRKAWAPMKQEGPLRFMFSDDIQKRVVGKTSRLNIPIDLDYSIGYTTWTAEFVAGDPRIYSDTEDTLTLNSPGATGAATNNGTYMTYLETAVITGPGTNFTLKNNDTGDKIKLLTTLGGGGASITVDFQARTIFKSDGTNLYNTLDLANSRWWWLEVGNNTLKFDVDSGSAGTTKVVYTWRDAWL